MARIHAPLSSFGAELQATLRAGANKQIKITFPTKALAIRFKQRIHALRNAMKHAKHPDWEQLYRCGVYEDASNPCVVTIGPKDSEFHDILAEAGIPGLGDQPALTEVVIGESVPGDPGGVDDFLADLTSATDVQKILAEDTEPEPDISSL